MVKDAALLMNPVEKERETVMEQEMEDLMMGTEDVVGTLYAAVTTANSLATTTTRRTTVVRDQQPNCQTNLYQGRKNKVDISKDLSLLDYLLCRLGSMGSVWSMLCLLWGWI